MTTLVLFHRDLRIADNETLRAACVEESFVCAVLRQDTREWGESKRAFYNACLGDLAHSLQQLGHELFIIDNLTGFNKIYTSRAYNTQERLVADEAELIEIDQLTLFKPDELPFAIADLPPTFTPFRKKIDKLSKTPKTPFHFKKLPPQTEFTGDRVTPAAGGGEQAALERLAYYFDHDFALSYFDTRNGMLEFDHSTKFSPYLAWGCISPERIYYELKDFEARRGSNRSTYWILFELLWRDYFKYVSLKFGDKIFSYQGTAQRQTKSVSGSKEETLLTEWINGHTREPFVNANMREIQKTGWMSNRGRQNVASYLCKQMRVSWLKGAEYFANHLIDYDVESNYGNWAYLAGVGVDPQDRMFNIRKQASMYDSEGEYQRTWLR